MGMLRERMEGDLKLKGFSANTQRCYLNCAARFAAHYGRSPALMGEREIRQFILHLVKEEHASAATQRMFVASLKFLYVVTLRRPGEMARVPFPKVPRRLPVVLTGSEAERVIACIGSIRHRTIAAVAYGAGLRIAEILNLKPHDIDSARGLIHVRLGKGNKDREVLLGERLLGMLREYWRIVRPRGEWLFPSPAKPGQPVSERAVCHALAKAVRAARLKKKVTPHLLRHSFATHLLELGNDIEIIQRLLGHSSSRTTRRYARVSVGFLRRVKTPFDVVGTPQGEVLR
jgi:integrase/recombinase XerD